MCLKKPRGKLNNPCTAHRSIHSAAMARCSSSNPFAELKISSSNFLDDIKTRSCCEECGKTRKFFCYNCYIPVPELKSRIPHVKKLPCKVDVIKHQLEGDGKSTAIHAAVIAPENVNIYTYPNIPDYETDGRVALLYPGEEAVAMTSLTTSKGAEIEKLVFIDSTWLQAKHIFKDPRLKELPCVMLKTRNSVFWRYQRGKPDNHLATIEAIYYALIDLDSCRHQIYDGHYDDLLFFFQYFHRKMNDIHFPKATLPTDQLELESAP